MSGFPDAVHLEELTDEWTHFYSRTREGCDYLARSIEHATGSFHSRAREGHDYREHYLRGQGVLFPFPRSRGARLTEGVFDALAAEFPFPRPRGARHDGSLTRTNRRRFHSHT